MPFPVRGPAPASPDIRHRRYPTQASVLLALAVLLMSCTAAALPTTGTLFYPEPFDFHYPDQGTYSDIADSAQVEMTLGETGSTTFVYVPPTSGVTRVSASDLVGPDGLVLPASAIDVGVVVFMNRARESHFLDNIWTAGVNQEVRAHAPVVPMAIVADEPGFLAAQSSANSGSISLQVSDHATAVAEAGEGSQFWVTVHSPAGLSPPTTRTTFRGDLTLESNGNTLPVPIEVTLLPTTLDELGTHQRYAGVFQTVDQFDPEFRDVVLSDLREHGVNTMFDRGATPADYQDFRRYGMDMVINADNLYLDAEHIEAIRQTGFLPLFYGFDEPQLHGTMAQQVQASRDIRSRGGLVGTSGDLATLQAVDAQVPQTFWNLTFATSWAPQAPVFAHFDAVRQDPGQKIADLEFTYPMTLLELYPLNTRLLYGLWLYNSRLDGGLAWAYSNDSRQTNPYTQTDWNGVAFPAVFHNPDGTIAYRAMIPSYVWEAFRSGVTDIRYALTVERILAQKGTPAEKAQFERLMQPFLQIYASPPDGRRIDARTSNATVRETRHELFELLDDLLKRT